VNLRQVLDDVVRRRERHVRPIADFGRSVRSLRHVKDVFWRETVAGDLLDCLIEPLAVVGQIDRQRRRAGGDDAEHVAFVNQLFGDLLEQFANASRVAEIEVQIVDEDQEDAAGRIVGWAARRKDDPFLGRRRRRRRDVVDAAAVGQRKRDQLLLDAVLEHFELVLLQVRDELPAGVADDHVGRNEFDPGAKHLLGIGFARRFRGRVGLGRRRGGRLLSVYCRTGRYRQYKRAGPQPPDYGFHVHRPIIATLKFRRYLNRLGPWAPRIRWWEHLPQGLTLL
jgi:hypothetical protein